MQEVLLTVMHVESVKITRLRGTASSIGATSAADAMTAATSEQQQQAALAWEGIAAVQDGTARAYAFLDGPHILCPLLNIDSKQRKVCDDKQKEREMS